MMEMYDNLPAQSPTTTTSSSSYISNATTTTIDSLSVAAANNNSNSSLVSWESLADNFLRQFNGPGTTGNDSTVQILPGSGGTDGGQRRTEAGIQLPFAAYQSLAAISTPANEIGNQFQEESGAASGGNDAFVSWAPTTPSQVFFFVKVVIMFFIIVSAVFGNLLVIVSVMRHRKLR